MILKKTHEKNQENMRKNLRKPKAAKTRENLTVKWAGPLRRSLQAERFAPVFFGCRFIFFYVRAAYLVFHNLNFSDLNFLKFKNFI
jgi:hypothetical protein